MREKILFVLQLPPPVHGASLMNQSLVNSELIRNSYDIRVLNHATSHNLKDIGKFSLRKFFSSVSILAKIVSQLYSFRPQLVYYTLSPSGFAFYRDALYIFIMRTYRTKVVFHLHGKGFRKGSEKSAIMNYLCRKLFRKSYLIHLSQQLLEDTAGFISLKKYV